MAETLFIRLPQGDGERDGERDGDADWAVFESDGRLMSTVSRGPLAGARAAAEGRRIVVLVPALEVMTTQAVLPAASQSRLRKIVPFSLEDALAQDVEQLVFAVGARFESGATAVAVAARERMDSWLAKLRAAGLTPWALCSEADGVPDIPATLALLIENTRIYGRRPGQPPLVFEGLNLRQVVGLVRGGDGSAGEDLRHVIVYVDAPARAHFQAELADLAEQFAGADVKLAADGLFARFAATLAQRSGTNLLQGAYAPKSNWLALAKPWRVAASLVLAVVVLSLLSLGVEYWSLRRADGELAELVTTNCQRLVGATRRSACEGEVQQRLRGAGVTSGADGFLTTLNAIAAARNASTRIDALSYRNGTMDLQVIAPDIPALDEFAQHLRETRRFNPVLESSTQDGDKVTGRFKVTGIDP